MSTNRDSGQSRHRRLTSAATRRLLAVAKHPYAFLPFTLVAATDSVMPLLPAELMAASLMVIQPHRARLIGAAFAFAAATSALILVLVIQEAKSYVLEASPVLADAVANSSAVILEYGAPALAVLSIFPDTPRPSIAAATAAGLSPSTIATSVFLGKMALYMGLSLLLQRAPQLVRRLPDSSSPLGARVKQKLQRLSAFQRLMGRFKN